MTLEHRPDASLALRETHPGLRIGCLALAVALALQAVRGCIGTNRCDSTWLTWGLVGASLAAALGARLEDTFFVFDPAERTVHWTRRRLFSVRTGHVPFSEITDVVYRTLWSTAMPSTRKLALVTQAGDVFVSGPINTTVPDPEGLRAAIQAVLAR